MPTSPTYGADERGRARIPECYRDLENWPAVDEELIENVADRRRYQRLCKGIALYLAFCPLDVVKEATGISTRRFLRLFDRCLNNAPDGRIWGFRACLRGARVRPMVRTKPIEYQADARAGFQGAFRQLLVKHPKIEERLEIELTRRARNIIQPNRLSFRGAHKIFQIICKDHGISENEYPFTTKAKGAGALREWIKVKIIGRHGERWVKFEEGFDAAKAYKFQNGDGTASMLPMPYSAWEIDENTIDMDAIYELPNYRGDWEEIELRRCQVIRAVDVDSGAKLANRLILAAQASAEDATILLWDAISGVEIDEGGLEAGLLIAGAGYPAAVIRELKYAVPRIIYLDNALAHLADHIQHTVTGLWGGEVMLGSAGTPLGRPNVETDFSAQARRFFHQLPGTTGSGPDDPVKDTSKAQTKNRVPVQMLAMAINCYCANSNALSAAAAGYIAPLERLRRSLASGSLAPLYLPAHKRRPHYFGKPYRVTVRIDLKNGRRPYVNFMYVRYSSELLMRSVALKDKQMWVRADFRDLRVVLLFDDAGKEFGQLRALGKWGKFPHDVRIRKLFGKLKREGELGPSPEDAPLEFLLRYLSSKAGHDRNAALRLSYILEYLKQMLGPDAELLGSGKDLTPSENGDLGILDFQAQPLSTPKPAQPESDLFRENDEEDFPFSSESVTRFILKM